MAVVFFQQFVEDFGKGVHDLNGDTFNVFLTNTAPNVATHNVKADFTEISVANGYTGPADIQNTFTETGGVGTMVATDVEWTATGAGFSARYAVIYNDTAASDQVMGYIDYGSAPTIAAGEKLKVDFGVSLLTMQF